MSQTVISFRPQHVRLQPTLASRARTLWSAFVAHQRTVSTRRSLATLDDRSLSDIGITRAQAQFVAEAPIWDRLR